MGFKANSSLILLVVIFAVVVTETAVGGRIVPKKDDAEVKHPEWLFHHDGSFLIPGIGRYLVPPAYGGSSPGNPSYSGTTGGRHYVPGGDDTFVPNPGAEVPNPGNGGGGATGAARP